MTRYLLFIALIWVSIEAVCQPDAHYFRHFQVEQGLSHNWVICSAADQKGYMWFGTHDGLCRYDGYSFKVYRHDDSNPLSLGANHIFCLMKGTENDLFVGNPAGLYIYRFDSDSFHLVPGTSGKPVYQICKDNGANIYFLSVSTVFRYNTVSGEVTAVSDKAIICTGICCDGNGLLVGTSNGTLLKYSFSRRGDAGIRLLKLRTPDDACSIITIQRHGDALLLGTVQQGLFQVTERGGRIKTIIGRNADGSRVLHVRAIVPVSADTYWVASESGLYIYNYRTGSVTNLRHDPASAYSLSDDAIYAVAADYEGGIWVGTYFGGLNYYSRSSSHIKKYLQGNSPYALGGRAVREIREDEKGNIWVGTEDNGLNRLDPVSGRITHFLSTESRPVISYRNLHGMLVASGKLWVGTYFHGLNVIDLKTLTSRNFRGIQLKNTGDFIVTIYKNRQGKILIGTQSSILETNEKLEQFSVLVRRMSGPVFFHNLFEDWQGRIWVGTRGIGLGIYDRKTKKIVFLKFRIADKKVSNSAGYINDIFEDEDGNIWVATDGSGIFLWDNRKNVFRHIGTENTLPSDYVFKVLQDNAGNFWISTSNGLVTLGRDRKIRYVLTTEDGLISNQFNYSSGYKATNGDLYFGNNSGMIRFDPLASHSPEKEHEVGINSFEVANKEVVPSDGPVVLSRPIAMASKISLPYDQSTFSIWFSAPAFAAPQKISYAFVLRGFQEDWTLLPINRRVYFTGLPPGTYQFQVKALGSNAMPGPVRSLTIEIRPPFWLTWWAKTLYALIAFLLMWRLFLVYRRRQLLRIEQERELYRKQKEKELYEEKVDFLGTIAHELSSPLLLISGPVEEMLSRPGDEPFVKSSLRLMKRSATKLIKLSDQLLDFRKAALSAEPARRERLDLCRLAGQTATEYAPEASAAGKELFVSIPPDPLWVSGNADDLSKVVGNLLSNAVKYAEKYIALKLILLPDHQAELSVTSDGPLIPVIMSEKIFHPFVRLRESEHKEGVGLGLSICRNIVMKHGGKIVHKIEDERNVFLVQLPLNDEA